MFSKKNSFQTVLTAAKIPAEQLESATLENGEALVILKIDPAQKEVSEKTARDLEKSLLRAKDVKTARVILTSEQPAPAPKRPAVREKLSLPHIKRIIAIASGKGGVGKSTVAVNIAAALAKTQKVGLLDADIYGPSQPLLTGIAGRAELNGDKKLIPFEKFGMKIMSIGLLADNNAAMIWRGPMVQTAILQMLRDVAWGELDTLIIDLPPGTGDAQLTLAQSVPLNGAVIISTPQDLSLIDARKGLAMFRKLDIPILGIIENMSTFICPHCNHQTDIFAHGGAESEAEKENVPFLGALPLDIHLRTTSDNGVPVVVQQPDGAIAKIFQTIAEKIAS